MVLINFRNPHLGKFVPQPRWLRRLYYKLSILFWGHPSNCHWKMWELVDYKVLRQGERDLWSGSYISSLESATCDCFINPLIK